MQDVVQKWSNYSSIELSGSVFPRTNQNKSPFLESGVLSSFFWGLILLTVRVSQFHLQFRRSKPGDQNLVRWSSRGWRGSGRHIFWYTPKMRVENKNEFICFFKKTLGRKDFSEIKTGTYSKMVQWRILKHLFHFKKLNSCFFLRLLVGSLDSNKMIFGIKEFHSLPISLVHHFHPSSIHYKLLCFTKHPSNINVFFHALCQFKKDSK